jgi:four helix bundle protein
MATANDFTELVAWQLSGELKRLVLTIVERPKFADRNLCEQMVDSAGSAPRNIAEGFGRFHANEFAHFLRVAVGSRFETCRRTTKCRAAHHHPGKRRATPQRRATR